MSSDLFDIPGVENVCGLTPVQEGLLADCLYDPESTVYHGQRLYRLPDDVDVERVREACDLVVDRHEICRTGIRWEDLERPVQVVHEKVELPWSVVDIDAPDADQVEAEIEAALGRDRAHPFDLRNPPLLRFTLLRCSTGARYLLWSRHHIILDRWSGESLMRQVMEAYAGGPDTVDEEEALPFSEYVEWLEQRGTREAEEFWSERLRGCSGGVPLFGGTNTSRGAADANTEMTLPGLSDEAMRRLSATARDCRVTVNTVAQGAWAMLVSKYTGETDVVHGTVTAGRSAELDGIDEGLGLYINVLPIRSAVDPAASVRSWLQSWQLNLLEMQEFEYVPLRDIKRWSGLGHRQSLFETTFSFASLMIESVDGSATDSVQWPVRRSVEGASYPLVVEAEPARNMELFTLYDPSHYSAGAVRRLMEHYRNLLEQIAYDPDRSIGSLRLLTDREREQQLVEWNHTARESQGDVDLVRMFEEQVRRTPDGIALVDGEVELTYRELNARANRLARHLRELGVTADTVVGVCLPRSAELVVSFLATSKAGGTYLPLDPAYPTDRLSYMVSDSAARYVISRSGPGGRIRNYDGVWIWLDELRHALGEDDTNLGIEPQLDSLAYVIYTSGSTGRPKGSMITHRGVSNLVSEQRRQFELEPGDRLPQFAALSFDAATFELLLALCAGATLCLGPRDGLDGDQLVPFLRRHRITAALVPPALLSAVETADLPELHTLWVAGEQCPAAVVQRWAPERRFFNLYGPTEGTIWVTAQRCEPSEEPPAIGRPIGNVRTYVLDRDLAPVPVGVPGDLYIGGIGLQRGYLGRAGLTAERMVPNPFPDAPGERLYRTGDRVRHTADGALEFLGRVDHQLAIHGYRVEAAEIEAQLCGHPAVRDAVVLQQNGRLVGYVRTDRPESAARLRAHLQTTLPAYMVPGRFVTVRHWPTLPNGKVDRNALLDMRELDQGDVRADHVEPEGELERSLARIWAQVLDVDRVGRHDNFFELGGDSILAIQIVSRSNRAGVRMEIKQLFAHPTVAELAAAVRVDHQDDQNVEQRDGGAAGLRGTGDPEDRGASTSPGEDGAVEGVVPLTPIQRWFFERDPARPEQFAQWVRLDLAPEVTVGHLQLAIEALIERHGALRTCFQQGAGSGSQAWTTRLSDAPSAVRIRQLDLDGMDDDRVRTLILKETESLQRDLDLERGELVGCELFDRGEQGRTLVIVIHHLVVDGVSWRILVDDLNLALDQIRAGEPVALGPPSTSFAEWATRLRAYAESPEVRGQRELWRTTAERSRGALPRDHDLGPNSEGSTRICVRELDVELTRTLLDGRPVPGAGVRVGIDEVLLTALGDTLSLWSGRPEVAAEVEIHGREHVIHDVDLSRTVGWFTATYPILLPGGSDDPFEPLRILRQRREALPHKGIGYGLLRYRGSDTDSDEPHELAHGAEVGFNYLGQWSGARDARGGAAVALRGAVGSSIDPRMLRPHPIEVNAAVVDGRLRIDWEYSENLHRRETIERLASRYLGALRRFAARRRGSAEADWAPSYYPLARVEADVLERLVARDDAIEDLYPLSPLQQGMLFHSVNSPTMYCHQAYLELTGEIDDGDLELAWRRAVDRNPSLRSSILSEGLEEPLQVVRRGVDLPVGREDWTGLDAQRQQEKLDSLLREQLGDGFDLEHGPLLRLAIVRMSSDRVRVVFTGHHIIFDRWSFDSLVDEILTDLEAIQRDEVATLPARRPYRDFIAWLSDQDLAAAQTYWRHRLEGFVDPTPVPEIGGSAAHVRHVEGGTAEFQLRLDAERTRALASWARRSGITLNTALQGAWALVLAGYGGRDDVVFGATTSGRPASLLGSQDMIGLFINTLPVRVRIPRDAAVTSWLRELQAEEVESRTYDFAPLYDIQRWSPVPGDRQLLETLMVFENSTWGESAGSRQVEADTFTVTSGVNYPLAVVVEPGARLNVFLSYDRTLFTEAAITRIASNLRTILEALPARAEASPHDLIGLLDIEQQGADEPAGERVPAAASALIRDVPPESQAELELLDLWEQVLGVRPSSVEASFYEIGGHSLLALRLAERANRFFGVEVSLIDLFKEPTIRSMARLLTGNGGDAERPLVPIQQGDEHGVPLFGVHPGNGSVRCYRRLAQRLDPSRTVYGLQDVWASSPSTPWSTIEEMASAYVEELRSVVPDGPYQIVGYSFGGWVAYEMARQLDAAGDRVGLLGLIDTAVPDLFRNVDMDDDPGFLAVLLRDLLHGSKRLEGLDLPGDLAGTDTERPLDRFVSIAWPHSAEEQAAGRAWIARAVGLYKREVEMAARYQPGPYERTVRLFRAQEPPDHVLVPADEVFADPLFGWGRYCSDIAVSWLPKDHGQIMFPPAIDLLADELDDILGTS